MKGSLDVEVVVEAVAHGRADAELRVGAQLLDGLGKHVRGGVPQHGQAVGAGGGDRLDDLAARERVVEVAQDAVDPGDDHVAGRGRRPASSASEAGAPTGTWTAASPTVTVTVGPLGGSGAVLWSGAGTVSVMGATVVGRGAHPCPAAA